MAILFTPRVIAKNLMRFVWCLGCCSNPGFKLNNPKYYLLGYGDFKLQNIKTYWLLKLFSKDCNLMCHTTHVVCVLIWLISAGTPQFNINCQGHRIVRWLHFMGSVHSLRNALFPGSHMILKCCLDLPSHLQFYGSNKLFSC